MKELKVVDVNNAFEQLDPFGVKPYKQIMSMLQEVDVAKDKDFQRLFNAYYKLRQRKTEWYKVYYLCMEKNKNNPALTFEQILREIFNKTKTVEASFSSKMLATINPKMPIWDRQVMKALDVKLPQNADKEKRLVRTVQIYDELCKWYKDLFENHKDVVDMAIKEFDKYYPKSRISNVKKIDFILWAIGK